MNYNEFGKTGIKLSNLGFGAMRLPMLEQGKVNDELAIPMMQRAFDLGVNYIDTAPVYCDRMSEGAVGRALKGYRDKVYVSTKNEMKNECPDDFIRRLESALKTMGLDYIDFYHFWGINLNSFRHWETLSNGPLQAAERAKAQGLIRHIAFSYHDAAENMRPIIDSGRFESVLMQYNLLDRSNEDNLAYAKEKGLGTVVMGPVGGGKLGSPSEVLRGLMKNKPASTAEMAMRFVLANPNVDVSLSGMSTMAHVEENVKVASLPSYLTAEEMATVETMMEENRKLAQLYCTSCDYCKPCPQDINIPHIFGMMNSHRVYGLTDHAKGMYQDMMRGGGWVKSADATKCIECGVCEEKCPQKLEIIKQLKETHTTLAQ